MRYWILRVVMLDAPNPHLYIIEGTEYEANYGPAPDEVSDVDTFGEYDGYATRAEAEAARDVLQAHV